MFHLYRLTVSLTTGSGRKLSVVYRARGPKHAKQLAEADLYTVYDCELVQQGN